MVFDKLFEIQSGIAVCETDRLTVYNGDQDHFVGELFDLHVSKCRLNDTLMTTPTHSFHNSESVAI